MLADLTYYDDPVVLDHVGKYRPAFAKIAEVLFGKFGATDNEAAEFFGVVPLTLHAWRIRYPEFWAACKLGDEVASDRMERALYQRGIGYSHPELKVHFDKFGDVHTFDTTKHYPPDVEAAKFWLLNKRNRVWQNKQTIAIEEPEFISTDDLLAKLNQGLKTTPAR